MKHIDAADRYTSMLGILPFALRSLLHFDPNELGYPERMHKIEREELARALSHLQQELLQASMLIFHRWRKECRKVHRALKTPVTQDLQGFAK